MTLTETIKKWVEIFNLANPEALSEFYSEDAINHQVANKAVKGKAAIKKMFEDEFKLAKMVCIIDTIFEAEDRAVLEWKDPDGLKGCGIFEFEKADEYAGKYGRKIKYQRGYWDKLSFLKIHKLPIIID